MKFKKVLVPVLSVFFLLSCNQTSSTSRETPISFDQVSSTSQTIEDSSFSSEEISSTTVSSSKENSSSSSSTTEEVTLWDDDIVYLMKEYLGGQVIPYIEMGNYAYGYWSNNASTFGNIIIDGSNTFKHSLFNQVSTTYTMAGWEVSETSSLLKASKESSHLSIELMEDSKDNTPLLNIYYDEPYDENCSINSWDNDIQDTFNEHLDGHILPYFYLGSKHVYASSYISSGDYFLIHGGRWDERIIDNANLAFTSANFEVTIENDVTGQKLTATKTFEDECQIKAVVYNNSLVKKKAMVRVSFSEAFDPNCVSCWNQDIEDLFTDQYETHRIPYFYLGCKNPSLNYQYQLKKATITGGKFDSRVLDYAKSAFTTDSYLVNEGYDNYGSIINAEKTFSDGCSFYITVSRSSYDKAQMTIEFIPGINVPDISSWDGAYTSDLSSYMLGHTLPYFYMGTSDVKMTYKNEPLKKTITLRGDTFNGHMPFWAKDAFENEGWITSLEKDTYGYNFQAEKTFEDGCRFIAYMPSVATYSNQFDTDAVLTVDVYEAYLAHNPNHYQQEVISEMSLVFSRVLPYVYLGTSFPCMTSDSSLKTITLVGSIYDSSMEEDFVSAFSNDTASWVIQDDSNGKKATTITSTGATIKATLKKNQDNLPQLDFVYLDKFEVPEDASWSTTITSYFNAILDNYIPPYLYLGGSTNRYYNSNLNTHSIILKGGNFDKRVLSLAKTTLENDNWTTSIDSNPYGECLDAYKEDEIKDVIYRCRVEKDGNNELSKAQVTFCMDESILLDDTLDYSSDIKNMMADSFDSHEIPYLDFGYLPTARKINEHTFALSYQGHLKNDYIKKNKEMLEDLGWEISENKLFNLNPSYYFSTLQANYTFSDQARIYLSFLPTLAMNDESTFSIYLSYYSPYENPLDGSYSSEILLSMKEVLGNHVLPYLYLGSDSLSYTKNENSITLKGGTWDEDIFTNAKEVLSKDTISNFTWSFYEEKTSDYGSVLIANGYQEETKDKITIKIYDSINLTYASHTPTLVATFKKGFLPLENTSWGEDITNTMISYLGNNVIPYIYLGCENHELVYQYDYLSHKLTITGVLWDEEIYSLMTAALENDMVDLDLDGNNETSRDWLIYEDYSSHASKTLVASCLSPYDTNKTITLKLYQDNHQPVLEIYYL